MQVGTCISCLAVGDLYKALADPTRRAILDELPVIRLERFLGQARASMR